MTFRVIFCCLTHTLRTGVPEDDFVYSYSGNQLSNINTTNTYTYDANGNCTADGLSALKLEYNYLNLTGAVKDASTNVVKASYRWLADGSKAGVKNAAGTSGYEYLSSLIYTRTSASAVALESAAFSGGRINKTSSSYEVLYFLTDHLGSTRVVINGATGKAIERNDYYPFGMKQPVAVHPTTTNRFRFSGKENQTIGDLPLQDFGARLYNPRIGRWITSDPLAELFLNESPYLYCGNNPIFYVDPDGMKKIPGGNDNENGTVEIDEVVVYANNTTESQWNRNYLYLLYKENPMAEVVHRGQSDFINHPVTQATINVMSFVRTGGIEGAVSLGGAGLTMAKRLLLRRAATSAETVAKMGMNFTRAGFRNNLIKTTGLNPGKASQAHHIFPQKFESFFNSKGINIHDPKFGAWWETTSHLKNASGYNAAWESFLKTNPSNPRFLIMDNN